MDLPQDRRHEIPDAHERRTHPRTVIAVDAACDLPQWYLDDNKIVVLPMQALGRDGDIFDNRAADVTEAFFKRLRAPNCGHFSVRALDHVQIQRFFVENVQANRDSLLQLTSAATSSMVFASCSQAAPRLMGLHQRARRNTNFRTQFRMWVMDSRTMFSGEAVLACAAVRQLKRKDDPEQIVQRLSAVRRAIHTLVVPTSTYAKPSALTNHDESAVTRLLQRWTKPSERAPVLHTYNGVTTTLVNGHNNAEAINQAFVAAADALARGIDEPTIALSYAGDLNDIERRTDYQLLRENAKARGVEVLLSPMSIVGASNIGAGALSIGFASHRFLI